MRRLKRIRGVSQPVQALALALRREQTPEEILLWDALRDRQLDGTKFRRQAPMGKFILDFYAPVCKLVIELDGAQHLAQAERDAERTACLAAYGMRVLRFTNAQIHGDMEGVLAAIRVAIGE